MLRKCWSRDLVTPPYQRNNALDLPASLSSISAVPTVVISDLLVSDGSSGNGRARLHSKLRPTRSGFLFPGSHAPASRGLTQTNDIPRSKRHWPLEREDSHSHTGALEREDENRSRDRQGNWRTALTGLGAIHPLRLRPTNFLENDSPHTKRRTDDTRGNASQM